jgi:hypothetical protein
MAGTVGTDLNTISLCEATTGWTAQGGSNTLNPDVFIQGANCIHNYNAGGAARGADYDFGGVGGSGLLQNKAIYCWFSFSNKNNIPVKGSTGLRLRLTDTSANYSEWDLAGSDTLPHGGWLAYMVHLGVTPSRSSATPCNLAAVRYVGWRAGGTVLGKTYIYFDAFRYGTGLQIYAGTSGAPATLADLYAAEQSNAYGVLDRVFGVYFVQGKLTIGSATAGQATYFKDEAQVVVFKNAMALASFYDVLGQGNATGTTEIYFGSEAAGSGISGLTIRTESSSQTSKPTLTLSDTNITKFGMLGCVFVDLATITLQAYNADKKMLNCTIQQCAKMIPSTCTVTSCNFVSADATALQLASASHNVSKCQFINCPKATEVTVVGEFTFSGMLFTGNVLDIENIVSATPMDVWTAGGSYTSIKNNVQLANSSVGQTFTGNGGVLANARFKVDRNTATAGTVRAKVYAHSGRWGTDGVPTGDPIATSNTINLMSLISGSFNWVEFIFPTGTTLENGTHYVLTFEFLDIPIGTEVWVMQDGTGTHGGNRVVYMEGGGWAGWSTIDTPFAIADESGKATINCSNGSNPSSALDPNYGCTRIVNTVTLTLTGLIAGSEVRIYTHDTTTELSGIESVEGSTHAYSYTYVAGTYVDIVVLAMGYLYYRLENFLLASTSASLPIAQQRDRQYTNP